MDLGLLDALARQHPEIVARIQQNQVDELTKQNLKMYNLGKAKYNNRT